MSFSISVLFSFLSAGLLVLSFPKFNLSFLAWIALVPVLSVCLDSKPKRSFLLGIIFGVTFYCGLMYWLIPTFRVAGESPWAGFLALLLLSSYLALYKGIFFYAISLAGRSGLRSSVLFPVFSSGLWVVLEYLRTTLFGGFPWGVIGYSQWNFLTLIQVSDIMGVYGVSFAVLFVNAAASQLIKGRLISVIRSLVLTVFVLTLIFIYGLRSLKIHGSVSSGRYPGMRVAILQGNIDQYKKWDEKYVREIMDTYESLALESKRQKPDLIIWPESSVPGYLFQSPELLTRIKRIVSETGAYHLVGSVDFNDTEYFNSAFLFSPGAGKVSRYDKVHLVPFGETVPFKPLLGKFIKTVGVLGDFSSGKDFIVFSPPFARFSASICFESIFPYISRRFVRNGAQFIVNITNDAWYLKTAAPYQHFAFNVFRAVENRRPVVRCANTGISGIIDKCGSVIRKTPIFETALFSADVHIEPANTRLTFYTRYGDVFAVLCLVLVIIVGVLDLRGRFLADKMR